MAHLGHGLSISDIKGKETMYSYGIAFANIRIYIESCFEIKINKESLPFILKDQDKYDINLKFISNNNLKEPIHTTEWMEDKLYTYEKNIPVTYVREFEGKSPYAKVIYNEKLIEILYLKNKESYFSNTHDILNLIGLEKILLDHSGFLLHSSLIDYKGKGILFSAPCGVGKSTQANLWEKYKNSEILNGDRAGLRWNQNEWRAYGMPFAGTSGIYKNTSTTVAAIVTLEQNNENKIRRLAPMEAIRRLLPECNCRRWDAAFMDHLLNLLVMLVQRVPIYLLQCRPDEEAVDVLFQRLKQEELI